MNSNVDSIKNIINKGSVLVAEPMKCHTTFKAGGNAGVFVTVNDLDELQALMNYIANEELPYFILGNGSNILVSDNGYDGIVIKLAGNFENCLIDKDNGITAYAGALLSSVSKFAFAHSLQGMEFASGIPGTIGGAILMNAGAYGGEMKQIVKEVTALVRENNSFEYKTYSCEEMEFDYRTSLAKKKEMVIVSCVICLEGGDSASIKNLMDELNQKRREKQPLEYPSAGSTFKRPTGYFAGQLIEEAGLKGYSVGDACISEKHAGFLINKGSATAGDIKKCMEDVSAKVFEASGVRLEPEVILIGDFD